MARNPSNSSPATNIMPPAIGAAEQASEEWDVLAAALNRWGVNHVAPASPGPHESIPGPAELFERLWRTDDARLHQATVFLLLTHPRLAADARRVIERLEGRQRDRAMRRYVAAASLQRMART